MFKVLRARLTRRALLGTGLSAGLARTVFANSTHAGKMTSAGEVDHGRNGFDPSDLLTDWDTGTLTERRDGKRVRSYDIVAIDKDIEIAGGLMFPAWTYAGRVPGPTIRVTEGDLVRIRFTNAGSHPHSIHFHGIHSARMDGIASAGSIEPGGGIRLRVRSDAFWLPLVSLPHESSPTPHSQRTLRCLHRRSRSGPSPRGGRRS